MISYNEQPRNFHTTERRGGVGGGVAGLRNALNCFFFFIFFCLTESNTVEPVLKDHPIGHKNLVCQDRWSLATGSVILKCMSFCRKCMALSRNVVSWQWSLKTGFTVERFIFHKELGKLRNYFRSDESTKAICTQILCPWILGTG